MERREIGRHGGGTERRRDEEMEGEGELLN